MNKLNDILKKSFDKVLAAWHSVGINKQKLLRAGRLAGYFLSVVVALFLVFYLFVFAAPAIQDEFLRKAQIEPTETTEDISKQMEASQRELARLNRRYEALTPKSVYLVVNTTDNRFYLYRNKKLIREGYVSTGSYIRLQSHDDREWLFKTPKGKHTIKGKIPRPVWRKPDWAFIEEGLPVPPPNHSSRFEAGVLGDYALSLGGGYLIHGTLYQRFLGLPVTHGCIRLNDEDLEAIYHALNVGSRVYIY